MRRIFKSSRRRLYESGFKAGYKKALTEMRAMSSDKQEVFDSFIAAIEEAEDEGVTDPHGIIDHWQQLYADDVLYGDNAAPMNINELASICTQALRQTGIVSRQDTGMLSARREIAKILQSYVDLRDDFKSRF